MADFESAFLRTMIHEGGYSNDPDDSGGETYRGISRKYNPQWSGWDIIDREKGRADFPSCLDYDKDLQNHVKAFYKDKYWDINKLDQFPQSIAEEMFDTGVNMGVRRAAKFLQKALNYLNRDGDLYSELVVDGKIGTMTLSALSEIESDDDLDVLLTMLNVLQGQHYFDYMDNNPSQKKYARGWFKRVKL